MTVEKIQDKIKAVRDLHRVARWLINTEIHKHAPIDLDDLADTSLVASEVEAVVECLESEDYEDAISISQDSAVEILLDEGFEI